MFFGSMFQIMMLSVMIYFAKDGQVSCIIVVLGTGNYSRDTPRQAQAIQQLYGQPPNTILPTGFYVYSTTQMLK